jgi:Zn finger protein HypA/HybF involved in hydrogenase expression
MNNVPDTFNSFGTKEMEENAGYRKRLSVLAWKLAKTIAIVLFTFGCAFIAIVLTDGKGEQHITRIAAFIVITELAVIWKPKAKVHCPECGRRVKGVAEEMVRDKGVCPKCKLKVNCPQCGQSLKGARWGMIGDTGVCPKCQTDFEIKEPRCPA